MKIFPFGCIYRVYKELPSSSQEGASTVGLFKPVISFQCSLDHTGTSEPATTRARLGLSIKLLHNNNVDFFKTSLNIICSTYASNLLYVELVTGSTNNKYRYYKQLYALYTGKYLLLLYFCPYCLRANWVNSNVSNYHSLNTPLSG